MNTTYRQIFSDGKGRREDPPNIFEGVGAGPDY